MEGSVKNVRPQANGDGTLRGEIGLVTPLSPGSANDGSGRNERGGFCFGQTYRFRLIGFGAVAQEDANAVQWQIAWTGVDGSPQTLALPGRGREIDFCFKDKALCGRELTITAYLHDPATGVNLACFHHNRFRWFDAALIARQIEQRVEAPWRIDQGQTSLCGMAALHYLFAGLEPERFRTTAIELHRSGEASLGAFLLKPNIAAAEKMYAVDPRDERFTRLRMFELDWLMLATSRSSVSRLAYDGFEDGFLNGMPAIGWPEIVTRLARDLLGFKQVIKHNIAPLAANVIFKKSILGRLHDRNSDTDLTQLQQLDAIHASGGHVLILIDSALLLPDQNGGGASYSLRGALEVHWVVYEGGLSFLDADNRPVSTPNAATRLRFRVYSWGGNPFDATAYAYPDDVNRVAAADASFLTSGVSVGSWKSNYFGFVELR